MTCYVHHQLPANSLEMSNRNVNPNTAVFSDITSLIDSLRIQFFLPLLRQRGHIIPTLSPQESFRLSTMALRMSRYDRAPALDQRGQWPFLAIAGPDEIWAAEVLLTVVLGKWIFCSSSDTSRSASAKEDILFLNELLSRLMV